MIYSLNAWNDELDKMNTQNDSVIKCPYGKLPLVMLVDSIINSHFQWLT